jgi:glycosyltransferase involved in cell wall biosynthesis
MNPVDDDFAPVFTVVIPAYNAGATIASSIRSVLSQTRDDWELVITDDGSADDTVAQVTAFTADGRIQLVRQRNRGLASARNAAIAHGRGRYVAMLDSDDLWIPTFLERMGTILERNTDVAFAHTDAWTLDDRTRKIRRSSTMSPQRPPANPPSDPHELLKLLLTRNFLYYGGMIRRTVLQDVGLYDQRLAAAEDYELWLRLLSRGHRGQRADGRLAVRRDRPDSLSSSSVRMIVALREVYRIVAEEYDLPPDLRDRARAAMLSLDRRLAAQTEKRRVNTLPLAVRSRLGAVKRAIFARWLWYASPPPEVAKAFPDLWAV